MQIISTLDGALALQHSPYHLSSQVVTGPLKLSVILKYYNSIQSNSKMLQ